MRAMQAMRQPLLSGAEIASTDENDRLQDLAIESRARHEGGAASAGTRFTAHEALFRNGQGYAYGKQVALDVRTLRGILVKPDPPASKRCAPDLQYQQRLALWEELQLEVVAADLCNGPGTPQQYYLLRKKSLD